MRVEFRTRDEIYVENFAWDDITQREAKYTFDMPLYPIMSDVRREQMARLLDEAAKALRAQCTN